MSKAGGTGKAGKAGQPGPPYLALPALHDH